jgi:hypothetical protein
MTVHLILAGSKAEAHSYFNNYELKGAKIITNGAEISQLWGYYEPVVHIVGTAFMRRDFKRVLDVLQSANAVIVDRTRPWMVTMPSLEIANVYSDRLGIDPSWRYSNEK